MDRTIAGFQVMKFVQLIALLCFLSPLYSRVIQGDANYYYKVLRYVAPVLPPTCPSDVAAFAG